MKEGVTRMWVVVGIQRSDGSKMILESTDGALRLVWQMRRRWWLKWRLVLEAIRAVELSGEKAGERTLAKWSGCFRLMSKVAVGLEKAVEHLE